MPHVTAVMAARVMAPLLLPGTAYVHDPGIRPPPTHPRYGVHASGVPCGGRTMRKSLDLLAQFKAPRGCLGPCYTVLAPDPG